MNDTEKAAELRRLIVMLLEKISDVRLLNRIYSFIDKLYCEQ